MTAISNSGSIFLIDVLWHKDERGELLYDIQLTKRKVMLSNI